MKINPTSWARRTGIYIPSGREIGKAQENIRPEEAVDNSFFRLRPHIALGFQRVTTLRCLSVGINRQRASTTTMPAIQHLETAPYTVSSRPTNQSHRVSNSSHWNQNDGQYVEDTGQPRRKRGMGQSGTVYQCPECELATLDLQRLKNHWTKIHADEHGPLCHANIEVIQ